MGKRNRRNREDAETRNLWERGPCDGSGNSMGGLESVYGANPGSSIYVDHHSALTLPAMFNGVSLISSDIASLPCNVYQNTSGGKRLVKDHPLNRLLDFEANPHVDAITFESAIFIDAILHGNGYAEVVRDKETLEPVALFNIPHGSMTPEVALDPENSITGNRLVYRLNTTGGGKSYLLAEDVLHLKGTTHANGLIGISLIDRALQSLGLQLAAQTNALTYFTNGSRSDGFLKYNGKLSPQQQKEYREMFYGEHGGVYRQNRLGFLGGDWSWIPTTIDPEKSQMLEQRKFGILDVCRWLNLPPIMLQEYEKATLSYEQSVIDYVTRTLRPWLVKWELELTRKLFTSDEITDGYEIKHDLKARLRGDSGAISNLATAMFGIGGLNRDEIRDLADYGQVEGGKTFYYASNNYTAIPEPGVLAPQPPEPTPETAKPPDSGSPEANRAIRAVLKAELCRIVSREALAVRRTLGKPDQEARIAKFYADHTDFVRESVKPAVEAYRAVTGNDLDVEDLVCRLVDGAETIGSAEDPGMVLDGWLQDKAEGVLSALEERWSR